MIFWKEWRSLRGRFFTLSGFYLITLGILPLNMLSAGSFATVVPFTAFATGFLMLFIPATLGMDALVGERDEGTSEFLLSKPLSRTRYLAAKIGMRVLLTLVLTSVLLVILLARFASEGMPLYLGTPPYLMWYLVVSILLGQLVTLTTTVAVSARAPYQSTAMIVGGAAGAVLAATPIVSTLRDITWLQAPWEAVGLLALFLLLTGFLAAYGITLPRAGRVLT